MDFAEEKPEPIYIEQELRVFSLGCCPVRIWGKRFKLNLVQGFQGYGVVWAGGKPVFILNPALLDQDFPVCRVEIQAQ